MKLSLAPVHRALSLALAVAALEGCVLEGTETAPEAPAPAAPVVTDLRLSRSEVAPGTSFEVIATVEDVNADLGGGKIMMSFLEPVRGTQAQEVVIDRVPNTYSATATMAFEVGPTSQAGSVEIEVYAVDDRGFASDVKTVTLTIR